MNRKLLAVLSGILSLSTLTAILALDQETLVSMSYFPQSQGKAMQPDDIRAALENVGTLVLSHKAAADLEALRPVAQRIYQRQ